MLRRFWLFFLTLFLLPLGTHAAYWTAREQPRSWSEADWSSAGVLPPAGAQRGAVVYVLAARTGRWKGIFAHHSWLVMKPKGSQHYTRYEVVGWGTPVRKDNYDADGRWYSNRPMVAAKLEGAAADRAIANITKAVARYPYSARGDYSVWPGPNSNTFIAYVVSAAPELAQGLLPTAVGKDYRNGIGYFGRSPSGTGWQLSLRGYIGISIGWVEGIELSLFGLIAGIDVRRPALKLPGWGRIGIAAV